MYRFCIGTLSFSCIYLNVFERMNQLRLFCIQFVLLIVSWKLSVNSRVREPTVVVLLNALFELIHKYIDTTNEYI